jgi:NTE family protein
MAYHAGVLAVLEHDLGWDPRRADVIVGTSAGAVIGSMLRRGVPASDLAALTVGASTEATPDALRSAVLRREPFPGFRVRDLFRPPRLPSPTVVARWAVRPWRFDPVLALGAHVADGTVDLLAHSAEHAVAIGDEWPEQPLWLCAVRRTDLRRVVFGRDEVPSLPDAVMASCSVPGYFRPVAIDGDQYVDGGVRSPTNADVLRRLDLDLVIVVSPMSGRGLPRADPGSWVRRYARGKVDTEIAALRMNKIATVVVEPGPDLIPTLGNDFMRAEHAKEIVAGAFIDAGAQLRARPTRGLVAGLEGRAPR